MGLDDLSLLGGERAWLVEDVVGDGDLAEVVEVAPRAMIRRRSGGRPMRNPISTAITAVRWLCPWV